MFPDKCLAFRLELVDEFTKIVQSARENFGNSSTNSKAHIRKLERILMKLYRWNVSLLFNQTCLNKRLLPNYTHTHTHTHIYTYTSAQAEYDKVISKQSFEFRDFPSRLVTIPRLKSSVCPTILPIAGGRIIGFILFPWLLALYEMLTDLSRIWTCVFISISYNSIHYTINGSSIYLSIYIIYIYIYIFTYLCKYKRQLMVAWAAFSAHYPK